MKEQKHIRTLEGTVLTDAMNKTIVVSVERRIKHSVYGKYMLRSSKIQAHDDGNSCHVGDRVRIREFRPLSKRKSWTLVEIIERAHETV